MPIDVKDASGTTVEIMTPDESSAAIIAELQAGAIAPGLQDADDSLSVVVVPAGTRTQGIISTAMTGTTSTAVSGMGAPGAGRHNYIGTVLGSNSHATVGTEIELQDGDGGATFGIIPAAALFGGTATPFDPPLKQPTANTALYAKNSVTGASTRLTITGYTAA